MAGTAPRHVGLMGKTGSGKSTLMDLLLGLLKPSAGIVEINGAALTERNRASWQSELAHVPQTIYLADCSIADNIALGIASDEVDLERIREVAAKAQILEFVERLQNGCTPRFDAALLRQHLCRCRRHGRTFKRWTG